MNVYVLQYGSDDHGRAVNKVFLSEAIARNYVERDRRRGKWCKYVTVETTK